MRAQIMAVHLLLMNLLALSLGPLSRGRRDRQGLRSTDGGRRFLGESSMWLAAGLAPCLFLRGASQLQGELLGRLMSRTPLPSPAELFGELLHEVQMRRLFPDGKYFVDMEPRHALRRRSCPATTGYVAYDDQTLAAFVAEHFDPPLDVSTASPRAVRSGIAATSARQHFSIAYARRGIVLVRQPQMESRISPRRCL